MFKGLMPRLSLTPRIGKRTEKEINQAGMKKMERKVTGVKCIEYTGNVGENIVIYFFSFKFISFRDPRDSRTVKALTSHRATFSALLESLSPQLSTIKCHS